MARAPDMARVYVSLGSNIKRERNIRAGVHALEAAFGPLQLSSVYESEAVGFDGDNFLNMVAGFDTALGVEAVAERLRAIEAEHGRVRSGPRFSARTLDIDLLLYDALCREEGGLELPRKEILTNAFVLQPLAEIAPDLIHPALGRSMAELWARFDRDSQALWPIPFAF